VEVTGIPFPVVQNVAGDPTSGAMDFAVSDDGTLVHVPGQIEINNIYDIDRKTLSRLTFGGVNRSPVWSPDGKRIAYDPVR